MIVGLKSFSRFLIFLELYIRKTTMEFLLLALLGLGAAMMIDTGGSSETEQDNESVYNGTDGDDFDDIVTSEIEYDSYYAKGGNDYLDFSFDTPKLIDGGEGDDGIANRANGDTLIGGAGDDTILGDAGDSISGGDGNDEIHTHTSMQDQPYSFIDAGTGNDTIVIDTSVDVDSEYTDLYVTGGEGADHYDITLGWQTSFWNQSDLDGTYEVSPNIDIQDFDPSEDSISIGIYDRPEGQDSAITMELVSEPVTSDTGMEYINYIRLTSAETDAEIGVTTIIKLGHSSQDLSGANINLLSEPVIF